MKITMQRFHRLANLLPLAIFMSFMGAALLKPSPAQGSDDKLPPASEEKIDFNKHIL